ncbi:hypothetical protein WJX79_008460 [Trebouxia sp. C0005]
MPGAGLLSSEIGQSRVTDSPCIDSELLYFSTLRPVDGSPNFLIIVPRTREVPDMITAASKFIHACQKLWALNVQLQLGQLAVFDTSDPQLSRQCIKPNSCPHIAAWRRINMSHRPVSVQLLANLSPKDATVFALVTDAASQTTAKSLSVSTGEALSPILDEVEQRMYIPAGTLAEEYTEGGVVTLARDEMVQVAGLKRKASQMSGASFGSAITCASAASGASADSKASDGPNAEELPQDQQHILA